MNALCLWSDGVVRLHQQIMGECKLLKKNVGLSSDLRPSCIIAMSLYEVAQSDLGSWWHDLHLHDLNIIFGGSKVALSIDNSLSSLFGGKKQNFDFLTRSSLKWLCHGLYLCSMWLIDEDYDDDDVDEVDDDDDDDNSDDNDDDVDL